MVAVVTRCDHKFIDSTRCVKCGWDSAPAAVVLDLLRVIDMLMPGVGAIAVEDYALLNDAPLRARRWLTAPPSMTRCLCMGCPHGVHYVPGGADEPHV